MTTSTYPELYYWLRLAMEPNLPASQARLLLAQFGLPPDIYAQSVGSLSKLLPHTIAAQLKSTTPEFESALQRSLEWASQPDQHIVCLADPHYPASLLETADPPLVLFCKGNLELLASPCLAIVGARSSTQGGEHNAFAFAKHLSTVGWTIVSGLASGIDAAAHEGSLAAHNPKASTIAVLGTGIDMVYPARNRQLAHRIAEHGLLISEFPLGTKALPYHFPQRNRVVAGLSAGVLVVEAAIKSGSLITAQYAYELGKEVFAIPGSIHSPLSKGCHRLIRQGAKLVEAGQDIHEELTPRLKQLELYALTEQPSAAAHTLPSVELAPELQHLLDQIGSDACAPDALQQRTQLDTSTLAAQLVELELAGFIYQDNYTGIYHRLG